MVWLILMGCSEPPCNALTAADTVIEFAGPEAVVCEDRSCVLRAHEAGDAAWFTAEPMGIVGGSVWSWLVTNDEGLWVFDHRTSERVSAYRCVEPTLANDAVACGSRVPEGSSYAVCGYTGGQSPRPIAFEGR